MATAQNVGSLIVKLMGDSSHFQKTLAGAQQRLRSFGTAMSLGVTTPLTLMGGMVVREFAKFDQAMTESTSIMKVTADQAQRMRDQALSLSKVSAQGPDEMARSYYFLASAGLDAEQAMAALPVVTAFATAGAFDMAKATEYLTDAQSALGLKVADATQNMINMARVSDVLVYAANASNASVEQFAAALTSKSASALKMFNKDIEEGIAVLAVMADQGIKSELAGNSLTRVLTLLGKASIDNAKEWKRFGLTMFDSSGKMRNMSDIVGQLETILGPMSDQTKVATLELLGFEARVQGAVLPLLGTSAAMKKYEAGARAAGGTTQEVTDKQMKSFSNQLKMMVNNLKVLGIELGEKLAPKILSLGKYIKDLSLAWQSLNPTVQGAIINITIFAAVLGPLALGLAAVAKILSVIGLIFGGIAAGTTGAVIAGVAALAAAFYYLTKTIVRALGAADDFDAKMKDMAKRGSQATAKALGQRADVLQQLRDMPAGPERDKAIAEDKTGAKSELKRQLKELQQAKKDLDKENTYWGNVFQGTMFEALWGGELSTAESVYEAAKRRYDATLKFHEDLEKITEKEKQDAVNANLAEMDRMDALAVTIGEYTKEREKAAATAGMTEGQTKIWEFAQEGATPKMLEQARAADLLAEAAERTAGAFKTGKSMVEEYLTPLEKFKKTQAEILQLLMVGAIGVETAGRASLAAEKDYKDAEKALKELQMKANIRINYDFTNNKAVEEGTDEFYRLMQLVPNKGVKAPEAVGRAPAGALDGAMLGAMEDAAYWAMQTAQRPNPTIQVKTAGL